MLEWRSILAVANIERRMIYRTSKFWILASIGMFFGLMVMTVSTIVSLVEDNFPGIFLLQASDATIVLFFFSFVQSILIVFVAGDFHRAETDARLDQVMLSRPLNTASWVLGKYFGVVSALLLLNFGLILLSVLTRTIKVIFLDVGFSILPILHYFTIVTLPSVLYMVALVFFLVSVLRARMLAIAVPLVYIASIFFYFRYDYYGLFDYGCFFAPLVAGDLIGFGNITDILWQRLMYVALAFLLVGFTILRYPRLRQSAAVTWSSRVAVAVAAVLVAAVGLQIYDNISGRQEKQRMDRAFQAERVGVPVPHVRDYRFEIQTPKDDSGLSVFCSMDVHNPNIVALDTLWFALNDALVLESVKSGDQKLNANLQHHVLAIALPQPLVPDDSIRLDLRYSGTVDADGFMLDRLPDSWARVDNDPGPFTVGELSAWTSPEVLMLPAESGWYPIPGMAAGYDHRKSRPLNFATATFSITAPNNQQVITQGRRLPADSIGGEITWHYRTEQPVPGFSLNSGPYRRLAWQFDDVEVELFFDPQHISDIESFADVADTCYEATAEFMRNFEQFSGLPYPYSRLSVIEVPLQGQVYMGRSGLQNIMQQPGIVMINEEALTSTRISQRAEDEIKRARRRGRDDNPGKVKRDVFISTMLRFFSPDRYWEDGTMHSPVRNYLAFQVDIRNPVLARGLEMQIYEMCEKNLWQTFFPEREARKLSANERMRTNDSRWAMQHRYQTNLDTVLQTLQKAPLLDVATDDNGNIYQACVEFKAPPIFEMLRARIGENVWQLAIRDLVSRRRYKTVDFPDLQQSLERALFYEQLRPHVEPEKQSTAPTIAFDDAFVQTVVKDGALNRSLAVRCDAEWMPEKGRARLLPAQLQSARKRLQQENIADYLHTWFETTTFPGYMITSAKARKLKARNNSLKTVYQMAVRVRNGEKGNGFVRIRTKTRNDRIWRNVEIGSYAEREVRFFTEEKPTEVALYPYYSRNRGKPTKTVFVDDVLYREVVQDTIVDITPSASDSLTVIVDDQDEGFFTPVAAESRYLRPPSYGKSWRERVSSFANGKYYLGWHLKRGERGDYPARWETKIPRTGDYEVSYYLPVGKTWYTRERNLMPEYEVVIRDGNTSQRIRMQPQETADGWIQLGRFHFEKNAISTIEVSDQGSGFVVADAVRWQYVE